MRETSGLPAGILAYVTAMVFLLLLFQRVFVAPQEWSRLITFATATVSFQLACWSAGKFSTLTGVKIVAVFIAVFWIVILGANALDMFSGAVETLEGDTETSVDIFIEFVDAVWNSKICAVVTIILAFWMVSK